MTLHEVTSAFESVYDPAWAASWDAVGLVCGDPEQPVRRILFAVDPVAAPADEVGHAPIRLTMVDGTVTHRE